MLERKETRWLESKFEVEGSGVLYVLEKVLDGIKGSQMSRGVGGELG